MKRRTDTPKRIYKRLSRLAPLSLLLLFGGSFLFCPPAFAQEKKKDDLPKEIRGYKVQRVRIRVKNAVERRGAAAAAKNKNEVFVAVGEPQLTGVSLGGVQFELSAEIENLPHSGTVDFLLFRDFRVNDLPVEIEEYRESFSFKKNETVRLPAPVKINLGAVGALRGALLEIRESKPVWTVTGRIFVFGRFKKSFLEFKRVVPVEINLTIKNPLERIVNDPSN